MLGYKHNYINQPTIENWNTDYGLKRKGGYTTKVIIAGPMLELEIYKTPPPQKGIKGKAAKESRTAQKNLNCKRAQKQMVRILNANFGAKDLLMTCDYMREYMPKTDSQAKNDMTNYLKRIKRHCAKIGFIGLKYLYVTEWTRNELTGKLSAHHHLVTNFPCRDTLEKQWKKGFRHHTRYLEPDRDFALTGLGHYLSKEASHTNAKKGTKRYSHSTNLEKPFEIPLHNKVPKREIRKMLQNQNEARPYLGQLFGTYRGKKYSFLDAEITQNEYYDGVYIYARMREERGKT